MTLVKILLATTSILVFADGAQAQDVLGQTKFNGKTIELNDDFTWRYVDLSASADLDDCFKVYGPYVFCGKALGWSVTNKIAPEAAASFRLDDRNYSLFIHESLGLADGVSLDYMQKAIINNAAVGAGVSEQDIKVYSVEPFEVAGLAGRRVVYGASINGLNFVYYNTVWLGDTETVQFLSFTVGNAQTDAALKLHTDALAALRTSG